MLLVAPEELPEVVWLKKDGEKILWREGDDLINGERFFAQEQLCYSDAVTKSINKRALAVFDYLSNAHPDWTMGASPAPWDTPPPPSSAYAMRNSRRGRSSRKAATPGSRRTRRREPPPTSTSRRHIQPQAERKEISDGTYQRENQARQAPPARQRPCAEAHGRRVHREHGAHPITPVYAATAQDTGPETATVTLTETVNGTLSFEGTDQMSKTVEVGTEVTVLATADEGYFADSLSMFTSDTEPMPSRSRTARRPSR